MPRFFNGDQSRSSHRMVVYRWIKPLWKPSAKDGQSRPSPARLVSQELVSFQHFDEPVCELFPLRVEILVGGKTKNLHAVGVDESGGMHDDTRLAPDNGLAIFVRAAHTTQIFTIWLVLLLQVAEREGGV